MTSNIEVEGLSDLPHILEVVGPDLGSALTLYQLTIYLSNPGGQWVYR
jgi:hypothetical protein